MRLLAITPFPPSTIGASGFGYHAVLKFLEFSTIKKIIVIADILASDLRKQISEEKLVNSKLTVDRQWQYNSVINFFQIIWATILYNPDVVWINLQYTSFGSRLISIFLGLCIPGMLRLLGYSVVVLLHNYLGGTDLDKMGFSYSSLIKKLIMSADGIAMFSIMSANKVFTMVESYQKELSHTYPSTDIEYVRQDLFTVPEYRPVDEASLKILTLGYFGTYKRLEILKTAFDIVKHDLPKASLIIAGKNNSHTPRYLESVQDEFFSVDNRVEFVGYVPENQLANLFWSVNLVVITNSTSAGDSGVVELARVYGRAILIPKQFWNSRGTALDSGIVLYDISQPQELAKKLLELLRDPVEQNKIGKQGYEYTFSRRGNFSIAHFRTFENLTLNRNVSGLYSIRDQVHKTEE